MRTFEAYLIYLAMYVTLHEILPLTWYATISLAVVTVAHLILERPRWQLAIAYGQVAYLLYAILISTSASWPAGYVFIALFEVGLLVSSALACLFPIAKFPELTGRYQTVGIDERFMLTKTSGPAGSTRPRSPSVDLTVYPELGMSVYYPSSLARPTKDGAQFLTSASISSLSSFLGLPNFLFQPLTLGRIRAVNNAPMARGSDLGLESRFPVILYSHGLGGHGHMYSIQCCELASQGYVVFAPTHNDGSSCVAELRSQIVPYKRLPGVPVHGDEEVAMRASQLRMRAREMEYLLDLITEGEADNGSGWSHISVSQKSPSSSSPPPYAGRLDLSRVGLIGHSFGAGTVTHVAAALASRVKCLIAHDVWLHPLRSQEPPTHTIPLQVPSLFTACDFWVNWPDQWEQIKYLLSQSHDSTLLHMNELQHSNFSDVPLFSQLVARKMKQIGPNNFRECAARVNAIQVAFLAQHMLGQDGAFELALKKNPQAIVIQRNP